MSLGADVEWVLAHVGEGDHDGFAHRRRAALRRVDPLRRAVVERRVRRATAEAALATAHALDESHVHRWALLSLRGQAPSEDDVQAVAAAFRASLVARAVETPRRAASVLLASTIVVCLALVSVRWWAPAHWLDPTRMPVSAQAFQKGGRPNPGDGDVASLYADALPAYMIALDRVRAARAEQLGDEAQLLEALAHAEQAVLEGARQSLGEDAASFLHAVLDQSRAFTVAREPPALESYLRSVDAFNAAVERRGLGHYLDAEVVRDRASHRVYLATFAVERVRWFRASEQRVRVLHLSREDTLNFVRGLLGFTRPHIRDGLVLLERVDAWLVDDLVPALAHDGALWMSSRGPRTRRQVELPRLEARAAKEVQRELARLATGCAAMHATGALFERRREVFALLSERAERQGLKVLAPQGYDVDVELFAGMKAVAGLDAFRELEAVSSELDEDVHRACFRSLRELWLRSIERHEAQHRLDFTSGALTRLPLELERRVGPLEAYGLRNVVAESAMAETSAYLSELARAPELVKANTALLARYVLDPSSWGRPEYFAALVIFEGLSRELGLHTEGATARNPAERVADLAALMLALDDGELSRAARRLWESLLGQRLVELVAE